MSEEMYNHRQRKAMAKQQLKSEKVPIDNWVKQANGEFQQQPTHWTTRYKQIRQKEKYNAKNWFERINRAQEYGAKVRSMNEEVRFNQKVDATEARENKLRDQLMSIYGEEKGAQIHDKRLARIEKRMTKKYGV